jgi:hypothetical protein
MDARAFDLSPVLAAGQPLRQGPRVENGVVSCSRIPRPQLQSVAFSESVPAPAPLLPES